jgi:hypothetical protein
MPTAAIHASILVYREDLPLFTIDMVESDPSCRGKRVARRQGDDPALRAEPGYFPSAGGRVALVWASESDRQAVLSGHRPSPRAPLAGLPPERLDLDPEDDDPPTRRIVRACPVCGERACHHGTYARRGGAVLR